MASPGAESVFQSSPLATTSVHRRSSIVARIEVSPSSPLNDDNGDQWIDDDGWNVTPISITVPIAKVMETRTVGSLYHRNIVSIVRDKITSSPDMRFFHYDPFEVLWQPNPAVPPMCVHSELYNSEAFLKAHRELQDSPPPPGCKHPRVVVGLMS